MPTTERKLRVFLCHAKEDKPIVREIYRQLTSEDWMDVWLDEMKLLPGQEWDIEIEKAVEQADVVIVCLSNKSVDKEGYVQKELRFVLNIADEKPEGTIFVVPLRLDDCAVPRRIRVWQYVDYFPKNNQVWAYQRLTESLKLRAGRLGIMIEDEKLKTEREQKAKEERERIAAQEAEAERITHEKAEIARKAQIERDRIIRQKVKSQRTKKALAETLRKINFRPILAVGGIILAGFILFFVGKSISENLPASPAPIETLTTPPVTVTSPVTFTLPTSTKTQIPPTNTPESPTITPAPTLLSWASLITYGGHDTGEMYENLSHSDTRFFNGTLGDRISISVIGDNGCVSSSVSLHNQDGDELAKNYGGSGTSIKGFTLGYTGVYYIVVDCSYIRSNKTWSYTIYLNKSE